MSASVALAAFVLASCASSDVELRADPALPRLRAQGYRIAVVPFAVSAPEEGLLTDALGAVGDVLSLEAGGGGLPMRARLGELMRAQVIGWLGRSDFEVVEPWATDTALAHHGWSAAEERDPSRAPEVAAALQVDGVLYGDVVAWNRGYYVVESTAEVGLRLELVDGSTGRSLFETTRIESDAAGLTGGPTGFVSAGTEPIAGLRGSTLRDLARAASRGAAIDLAGGDVGTDERPADAPRLSFVSVALPHSGPLVAGDRVDVLALGAPGCNVCFDLGVLRRDVPMLETARHADPRGERASYAGHYVVQAGDAARGLPVFATIRGQRESRVSASRYRWGGSVDLGAAAAR
ncbi:MAG: hypothetical protein IPM29_22615 [Planctomycetes bacterium]|nr:hypothetical protein [Planctomycetota bacterium]